jgi:hypothetical protein
MTTVNLEKEYSADLCESFSALKVSSDKEESIAVDETANKATADIHNDRSPNFKLARIMQLKNHLLTIRAKHKVLIMKSETLKDAHIYCVINRISAQQYGPLLERFIQQRFCYIKTDAKDCRGDCTKDGKNCEIKVSLGGALHCKFNYVQIRPAHDCDIYILTAYHLCSDNVDKGGDLYIFKVPTKDIKALIVKYGGYAHGTIKEHGPIIMESFAEKNNKEYALRPSFNDECWKALLAFQINEAQL